MKNSKQKKYFYQLIDDYLSFIINTKSNPKILLIGYSLEFLPTFSNVSSTNLTTVSIHDLNFNDKLEKLDLKYDYVILLSAFGFFSDIYSLTNTLKKNLKSSSRIIIYQHNYLWSLFLSLVGVMSDKSNKTYKNWLSVGDISSVLEACGYEVISVFKKTLLPLNIPILSKIFRMYISLIPFLGFFKINQFIVARVRDFTLSPADFEKKFNEKNSESLTICITVRNERDNIESIVKNLPIVCKKQEILFVEGHSTDGTFEKVEEVAKRYIEKNVRVIKQPGIGQGDAIRVGFYEAKGDNIILYEGDGTSDPNDISYFYNTLINSHFEFIQGTRFIYPLKTTQMAFINQIGNMFFAKWFSLFFNTYSTDVLSGIKGIKKWAYLRIYNNWGFLKINDPFGDFELAFGAARAGLKVGEVPMKYYPRVYGESKTKVFHHGFILLKFLVRGYTIFKRLKSK